MKQGTWWKITKVVIICLFAIVGFAQAQETNDSDNNVTGEYQLRYDWFGVNGDKGRFREDNWMTDRSTGGLDWLRLESIGPDKNGYEWLLEGRALHDYDYGLSFLMKKQDSHYIKLDFSSWRRYYDGSNEYDVYNWDPGVSNLIERPDGDFFVDRRNYNIELGLTPPEEPHWVFGWHRLERDGKEVLLHGSRRASDSSPYFYGIANVSNLRGISDTFYGEVSHTFADKYNFRIRQEFEQYHGEQRSRYYARYDDDGTIDPASSNYRWYKDDFGYTNWRTMFMFDSFLDKETYVTANYMYNYLNSNGTQDYYQPTIYREERNVGNSRRTNVAGLGYRRANVLQIPGLDFSAGLRVEDSKTDSQSLYWYSGSLYQLKSSLDEVRVAESLRLVYRGIERTTLSFDADLEQRDLNWEARRYPSYSSFDRTTDTDYLDQIYTFKGVHRFNQAVKSTVKFRLKDLERSMTNLYRPSSDYPGWLGNNRRTGRDLTVKTDFRINSKSSTSLLYQFVQESIDFELGGKTSNQEIHRGAGNLSFSPAQNLFLVGTFMLENYKLDTPVAVHDDGPRPFDFRGNSYSLMLDGTYAFNEKTSCTLGLRHTEAMGTVDSAGDYVYDTVGLAMEHKFAENKSMSLGYQFLDFNNHDGGSFDDYRAHGLFISYKYRF